MFITKRISDKTLEINEKNHQDEILENYLESMEKLLLDYKLSNDDGDNQARNVARFKTLTVLRRLTSNPEQDKSIILKFLRDTELIQFKNNDHETSKLRLAFCDFQKANLGGIELEIANLIAVNFIGASFKKANLRGSVLIAADLRKTDFTKADLRKVDLSGSVLLRANLKEADLRDANLKIANLKEANFKEANLTRTNLEGAYLYRAKCLNIKDLKSAKNWEKAIFTRAKLDKDKFQWIVEDKENNELQVEIIRNSTSGIVGGIMESSF
ncbi:pentapeptide repeat-containing protein [Crocosphaera sp. Alani8]|uniref:pentapeptide repeat-containing protein n=1 Tax=Crocosphaera sp. Alani8 TaxID=3038952 RepID=UPI00313F17D4